MFEKLRILRVDLTVSQRKEAQVSGESLALKAVLAEGGYSCGCHGPHVLGTLQLHIHSAS